MPGAESRIIGRTIDVLEQGVIVEGFTVKGMDIREARFREEKNMRITVYDEDRSAQLCFAKIFTGRPPYYRPWIELFDIYGSLRIANKEIGYYGSDLEEGILRFFADALEPGENLFVEYFRDQETKQQLHGGVPAPATRLGKLLYDMGFTWFKDWYFPEGFMEGEQKLQAEKPLNAQERHRQNTIVMRELNKFMGMRNHDRSTDLLRRTYDRAAEIISKYRPFM